MKRTSAGTSFEGSQYLKVDGGDFYSFLRYVTRHFLGVADDRETPCCPAGKLLLRHRSPL